MYIFGLTVFSEIIIFVYEMIHVPRNMYFFFVFYSKTGTFSDEPDIKAIKTELMISAVYITGPTTPEYLKTFEDTSSEASVVLIGMITEIVSLLTFVF